MCNRCQLEKCESEKMFEKYMSNLMNYVKMNEMVQAQILMNQNVNGNSGNSNINNERQPKSFINNNSVNINNNFYNKNPNIRNKGLFNIGQNQQPFKVFASNECKYILLNLFQMITKMRTNMMNIMVKNKIEFIIFIKGIYLQKTFLFYRVYLFDLS